MTENVDQPWLASSGVVLTSSGTALASGAIIGAASVATVTDYSRPLYLVEIGLGGGDTLRLASEGYTSPTSEGANLYAGDLGAGTAVRYQRAVEFWPWRGASDPLRGGGSRGTFSSGQIDIANEDGRYDYLLDTDLRDQPVTVRVIDSAPLGQENSSTGGVVTVTALVDNVSAPDDRTVRIDLTDPLTRLDRPLQTATFSDDADDSLVDRPQPILLGVARNIRPLVYDGPDLEYRITDGPVSGIGVVRDKGIPLDPTATPDPQWTFNSGATGFVLDADPVGVVTCDASTVGDAILPPSPTDELSGNGFFDDTFSGTFDYYGYSSPNNLDEGDVALPPGWTYEGGFLGADGLYSITPVTGGGIRLENAAKQTASQSVISTATLSAGASYRWTLRVFGQITGGNPALGQYARLIFRLNPQTQTIMLQRDSRDAAGTFSGTVNVASGAGAQSVEVLVENTGASVSFGEIEIFEITDVPEVDLEAITLEDYVREVAITRAQVPADDIDLTSFADLDNSITGGNASENYGIGAWLERPRTILDALRLPLDSYGAAIYSARNGQAKAVQMQAPELLLGNASATLLVREIASANNLTRPEGELIIGGNSYFFRPGEFDTGNPNRLNGTKGIKFLAECLYRAINGTGTVGFHYSSGTEKSVDVFASSEVTEDPDSPLWIETYRVEVFARQAGASGNSISVNAPAGFSVARPGPVFFIEPYDKDGNFVTTLSGGVGDGSTALTIDAGNLAQPPQVTVDRARGLTSAAEARLNWYQYRDGDFADDTSESTGITLAERQAFVARGQKQIKVDPPALSQYRHADQAGPIATVFDAASGAQESLSRINTAYGVLRYFYDCEVWLDPTDTPEPGDIVTLTYPRYGLDAGKPCMIVGIDDALEGRARRRLVRLRLWG